MNLVLLATLRCEKGFDYQHDAKYAIEQSRTFCRSGEKARTELGLVEDDWDQPSLNLPLTALTDTCS